MFAMCAVLFGCVLCFASEYSQNARVNLPFWKIQDWPQESFSPPSDEVGDGPADEDEAQEPQDGPEDAFSVHSTAVVSVYNTE